VIALSLLSLLSGCSVGIPADVKAAYFVNEPTQGRLKVSFFGPFYGAYNVISLDENYGWSLVCGKDYAYLWILSRTPELPDPVVKQLVAKAKGLGFKTDELVFVNQK
jgi:apolipoprotein D and lipocalin family protein